MKLKNKILPLLLLASTAVGCTDGSNHQLGPEQIV